MTVIAPVEHDSVRAWLRVTHRTNTTTVLQIKSSAQRGMKTTTTFSVDGIIERRLVIGAPSALHFRGKAAASHCALRALFSRSRFEQLASKAHCVADRQGQCDDYCMPSNHHHQYCTSVHIAIAAATVVSTLVVATGEKIQNSELE